jgi:hypothetical protein
VRIKGEERCDQNQATAVEVEIIMTLVHPCLKACLDLPTGSPTGLQLQNRGDSRIGSKLSHFFFYARPSALFVIAL